MGPGIIKLPKTIFDRTSAHFPITDLRIKQTLHKNAQGRIKENFSYYFMRKGIRENNAFVRFIRRNHLIPK
jgi:hypothetical protein